MTTETTQPPARVYVDQIIESRWIIPVEPDEVLLENHAVVIDKGLIRDLLPAAEAARRYRSDRYFRLDRHVLIPGLVNLHTHAAMSLLRGFADDKPLMRWLQDHIWPAEGRHISSAFVRDGTRLACWEMLRGGITCFNDMYFFPEAAAAAALDAGIRAALGITVFEFPSAYGTDAADYLHKGLEARDRLRDEPLISFCLAPHAPYTVSNRTFEQVGILAHELRLPIHIHLHETQDEIAGSIKEHGMRPLARLDGIGLLGPELIAVHAVHLEACEIDLLARLGCHVAHCPTSNMKLASGIAPVGELLDKGVSTGLGTDGAASNNRLDIFQEMRQAALLAKVAQRDAAVLPAHRALRMATLEGARALGLGERTGSISPGKAADLTAVSLDDWISAPIYDPVSHLVYVANRENVTHVWVDGKLRIDDKTPRDLDEAALLSSIELWQNGIIRSKC